MPAGTIPILVSSDDENGEVTFVRSSTTIPQATRHDAIVVTSDTDSEEEDLLDMVSQISSLISCQRDEDHIGISQDPAPKSRLSTEIMEDELMFDGIDDEDSMELEESTKTLVAERSMVSNQLLSKSQRKKSSLERAVSSSLDSDKPKISKVDRLAEKDREKHEKRLRKQAEKVEKEVERSFQKKVIDVNRLRTTKNDAVREIHLYLSADLELRSSPLASALPEIRARITESLSEVHFLPASDSPVAGTIRIKRHVQARWDSTTKRFIPLDVSHWEWEPITILAVHATDVVDKILHGSTSLVQWIRDVRLLLELQSDATLILVIKGMAKLQAKLRTQANREYIAAARAGLEDGPPARASVKDSEEPIGPMVDNEAIGMEFVNLQITAGVHVVNVEKTEDVEDWIWNLVADIALRPYKLASRAHLSFAPSDHPRKAYSSRDALELALQEVQGITLSAAAGITAKYPTFSNLMRAFEKAERTGGVEKGESLLAECEVKTLKNGTASGRKLNKALARRVYHVFRGQDSLALA